MICLPTVTLEPRALTFGNVALITFVNIVWLLQPMKHTCFQMTARLDLLNDSKGRVALITNNVTDAFTRMLFSMLLRFLKDLLQFVCVSLFLPC